MFWEKAEINRKKWNKYCFGKSKKIVLSKPLCDYTFSGCSYVILYIIKNLFLSYVYLLIRWWMKTLISSLARFIPGHIRGPLPNPRKLKGLRVSCNWMKVSILGSLEIEMAIKVSFQEETYIKSRGIKLFRIWENFGVMVYRNNI